MTLPGKRQTRWSQKQRRSRRCTSCGSPAEEFSLCPPHRLEQRQRMRERRASGLEALLTRLLQRPDEQSIPAANRGPHLVPVGRCRVSRVESARPMRSANSLDHDSEGSPLRSSAPRERDLCGAGVASRKSLACDSRATKSATGPQLRTVFRRFSSGEGRAEENSAVGTLPERTEGGLREAA